VSVVVGNGVAAWAVVVSVIWEPKHKYRARDENRHKQISQTCYTISRNIPWKLAVVGASVLFAAAAHPGAIIATSINSIANNVCE